MNGTVTSNNTLSQSGPGSNGLVWFICQKAYQLLLDYLMLNSRQMICTKLYSFK